MIKKVLILLCVISIFKIMFVLSEKSIYKEGYKEVIGTIKYIEKKEDKTIMDINKYRITVYSSINYSLGDKVKVKGVFKTPFNNTIPNTFNYRKYLLSKNIKEISINPNVTLVRKNKNIIYKLKNAITKHINKYKSKNYIKCFVLAEKDDIDDNVLMGYKNMGISHLIAVSGMHVGLILTLINKLLKNNKHKVILTSILIIMLLILTNFSHSLLRCAVYICMSFINNKLKLNIKNTHLLLITALLILLINPYLIYSIGFLFSVSITFYILLINKKDLIKISLVCFLSSIPMLALFFYKINLLSVLYNIIFVPIFSLIIFPLGIITLFIPMLDNAYLIITNYFDSIIVFLSRINVFTFVLAKPNILMLAGYYIFLYLFIKKNKKYIMYFLVIFIINLNMKYFIFNPRIIFLDVGQGDSILLIYPKGKSVLIDTGKNNYASQNTITYLNSLGISKLNSIIITHGDQDHAGEAITLVNSIKVEKVIFNCGGYNDLEQEIIRELDKKHIKYYSCINRLDNLLFLQTKEYDNENYNSNVIYTELNGYKFMFMGDASITTEREILDKYNLPNIDVLKVGHHGSKTSSGIEFINKIKPKYSIISVGKKNRYGHPNKEALNNLKNSKMYRTDKDGSIMFKIKNNKLQVETCSP